MSFGLFLIYLIFVLIRPIEALGLELAGTRPMLLLWVAAFGSALLRAATRSELAGKGTHFYLLGGLMVVIMLSQIAQGWLGGAIGSFAHFSTSAGLFVLICMNVTTMRRLELTGQAVLASITVVAAMSVFAYHTGWKAEELVLAQGAGGFGALEVFTTGETIIPAQDDSGLVMWRVRGLGFMSDPNDLAQAIVMVLPLLWGRFRKGRIIRNLWSVWLPGMLLGYTIYLTHSRGALIGLASLFFFGLRDLLAIGGVLAAIAGFAGGRGFSSGEESASDRIEAWYEGLGMLKNHPLFGVGYFNFTDHHHLTAHNSFVLCFAELGLFGYFFWVALLVLTYQGMSQVIRESAADDPARRMAVLLRSSFLGFMTCAWFLSRTYAPTLYILLALCTAVWYCWLTQSQPAIRPRDKHIRWVPATFGTMAAGLVGVYLFVFLDTVLVR